MSGTDFDDFGNQDNNLASDGCAEREFAAELLGKLKAVRKEKGFTQAQLAKASGLKQSAIARLESMSYSPRIDTLIRVVTALGYKLVIVPIDEKTQA